METSNEFNGETLFNLTSFVAATPASPLAPQANETEPMTHAICGPGYSPPLANYDLNTQSWKMYGDTYLWGDSPLLETLPPSGMTQNGVLFPQPAWVPIIAGTASLLWPTPTTQESEHPDATLTETGRRLSKNGKTSHSLGLADAARMWPTPRASTAMGEKTTVVQSRLDNGEAYKGKLEQAVAMWPTPTASSWGNEGSRMMLDKRIADGSITEQDKRAMTAGNGGRLNPMWVEWLMGFPPGWTDLEDSETP